MLNIRRDQAGIGLVEVMVAAALLGGLSLVVMQLSETGQKSVTRVEKSLEASELDGEINSYVSNKQNCTATVGAGTSISSFTDSNRFPVSGNLSIKDFADDGSVIDIFTPPYTRNFVTVDEIYLIGYTATGNDQNPPGTARLIKKYTFRLGPNNTTTKTKSTLVSITDDGTGSMASCVLKASESSGPWIVDDYGIYYDDGSVAIRKVPLNNIIALDVVGEVITGKGNAITGTTDLNNSIFGGSTNTITGTIASESVILGGNDLLLGGGTFSAIVGGQSHALNADRASIIAGESNYINGKGGLNSVIAGGLSNSINSTSPNGANGIVVGTKNIINRAATGSGIFGGIDNVVGNRPTAGQGNQAMVLGVMTTGGGSQFISPDNSVILGGSKNHITSGNYSAVLGGSENTVSEYRSAILGGATNTIKLGAFSSVIAGGTKNIMSGKDSGIFGSTESTVSGSSSVSIGSIAGKVSGNYSGVYSGGQISVTANQSVVIGGGFNTVTGDQSAIIGGNRNTIKSKYSFVGGRDNTVAGDNTFAWGRNINQTSAFKGNVILTDGSGLTPFVPDIDNQFKTKFTGGFVFCSDETCSRGAKMEGGNSGWTNISDKNRKKDFKPVNLEEHLVGISELDIPSWIFKGKNRRDKRYVGPMAQDFYRLFAKPLGLNSTETAINSLDMAGVTLVGVKGLVERTTALKQENAELKTKLAHLEDRVLQMERQELESHLMRLKMEELNKKIDQLIKDN